MATFTFRRLALLLLFLSIAGTSQATDTHRLRFFLNPDLVASIPPQVLSAELSQYAADINAVFAKQTIQRFTFNPATDITITATTPQTDSASTLPTTGYEMWVHAVLTDMPAYGTYGGYAGIDVSGAAVAAGLKWDAVHNPSTLIDGSAELRQYWTQIDHIVHEFEHGFGAGVGEYYSFRFVDDPTGVAPIVNIRPEPENAFWGARQDYFTDPLLNNIYDLDIAGQPTSLTALRDTVRFAKLSVAVIDQSPRPFNLAPTIPDLSTVSINLVDNQTGLPIPDALVRVWNVVNYAPYDHPEKTVTNGLAPGSYQFNWGALPFGNTDNLLLIKAFANGYEAQARWFTTFDAQYNKLVNGVDHLTITLALSRVTPLPGDFNNDGAVDAADYVMWRNSDGSQTAYNTWRAHFGQTVSGAGLGIAAVVPEPTFFVICIIVPAALLPIRRKRALHNRV